MFKNVSWSRGFFRLWLVYALAVVIITGGNIHDEKLRKVWHFSDLTTLSPREELDVLRRMAIVDANIRIQYPEYKHMKPRELFVHAEKSNLWDERMEILQIGLGFLFIPLLAGLMVRWILLGFKEKKAN
jgi:hypothetical protein